VKNYWAGVQNLQNQLFSFGGQLLFATGLWLVRRYFLDASWRVMLLSTAVLLNVIDMPFVYLTVYDVVRNQCAPPHAHLPRSPARLGLAHTFFVCPHLSARASLLAPPRPRCSERRYFYLGETVLVEIPAAANFVVSTYVIVEMAEAGNEGLIYGLLTTTYNLGHPVATAIGNQLFSLFTPALSNSANYVADTPAFRNTVAASFALSYFFSFAALLLLPLLPGQKDEAQRRKRAWSAARPPARPPVPAPPLRAHRSTPLHAPPHAHPSPSHRRPQSTAFAVVTLVLLGCGFCYSLTVNILAMIPETMCLRFVGGEGCHKGKG